MALRNTEIERGKEWIKERDREGREKRMEEKGRRNERRGRSRGETGRRRKRAIEMKGKTRERKTRAIERKGRNGKREGKETGQSEEGKKGLIIWDIMKFTSATQRTHDKTNTGP